MASADFSPFVVTTGSPLVRPPRIRILTFPFIAARFTDFGSGQLLDFSVFGHLVHLVGLLSDSCSSAQGFASGFLQIPPRDGHPYLWLILPTAGRIEDLHLLVNTHVGRTKKEQPAVLPTALRQN